MAMHAGSPHVVGHKPVTHGGWGVALGICALALALWIGAWMIHRATFEDPFDPLSPGSEAAAGGHGAPAAEHGGAAGDHEAAPASGH